MFLNGVPAADKLFYTTGRLTSEMVIKTVQMGIPALVSRSGFTAWGVDLARQAGLTLVGRMKGRRFIVLAGEQRLVRSEEHTSELQSIMRLSYAVFRLKKKKKTTTRNQQSTHQNTMKQTNKASQY